MRGTPSSLALVSSKRRIIPADAGNTFVTMIVAISPKDHPRGCGEHRKTKEHPIRKTGSSPRMRGTPMQRTDTWSVAGIIPADAGNTAARDCRRSRIKDHPRGCGEHLPVRFYRMLQAGSSPRMRGTRWGCVGHYAYERIIPADAGNTTTTCLPPKSSEDHPRGCGEHHVQAC